MKNKFCTLLLPLLIMLAGCDMNSDLPPINISVQQPPTTPTTNTQPSSPSTPQVAYPVVHSSGNNLPLSNNVSGISLASIAVQGVQATTNRTIANMKLTNNAGVNMTRVLVKLKITTTDQNVQGGFVLYIDGTPVESRDWKDMNTNNEITLDAWGFNILTEANVTVQLYSSHSTGDTVQATVINVQTDTGQDTNHYPFSGVLCG